MMGGHGHPEVTLHTPSFDDYMEFIYRGDWQGGPRSQRSGGGGKGSGGFAPRLAGGYCLCRRVRQRVEPGDRQALRYAPGPLRRNYLDLVFARRTQDSDLLRGQNSTSMGRDDRSPSGPVAGPSVRRELRRVFARRPRNRDRLQRLRRPNLVLLQPSGELLTGKPLTIRPAQPRAFRVGLRGPCAPGSSSARRAWRRTSGPSWSLRLRYGIRRRWRCRRAPRRE